MNTLPTDQQKAIEAEAEDYTKWLFPLFDRLRSCDSESLNIFEACKAIATKYQQRVNEAIDFIEHQKKDLAICGEAYNKKLEEISRLQGEVKRLSEENQQFRVDKIRVREKIAAMEGHFGHQFYQAAWKELKRKVLDLLDSNE